MILADSTIWIDHLRQPDAALDQLMSKVELLVHPFVTGEVAMGSLKNRTAVIDLMSTFFEPVLATHREVLRVVEKHDLAGTGLGWVDAHLLTATLLTVDAHLWTRDKRLRAAAERLNVMADLG